MQRTCVLDATGDPKFFSEGQVLVGEQLKYDTCRKRGVVDDALTNFQQGSTTWFLRGDVAKDSLNNRIFAGNGDITSCDLPIPHYHFHARQIKWVSNTVLVARPVVLYIQDVPVLWLPFIFQDMRPGRHSGLLTPAFGISDIIRPSSTYSRQFTNMGYYWATNDYLDLSGWADWYSNRYVSLSVLSNYRWLNRFLNGSVQVTRIWQDDGGSSLAFHWNHTQQFNLNTRLNFSASYATNTSIINNNAVDPLLNTQQITSQLLFTKTYRWGTVVAGRQPAAGHFRRLLLAAAPALQRDPEADRPRVELHLVAAVRGEPGYLGKPAPRLPQVRHAGRDRRLDPDHHGHENLQPAVPDAIPARELQLAERASPTAMSRRPAAIPRSPSCRIR